MSSPLPILAILVLGLVTGITGEDSTTTSLSAVSVGLSGGAGAGGNTSFSASGNFDINIHLEFSYDFGWFFTALQGVLDAYAALIKILLVIVDGQFKAAIDLFVGSVDAALAFFQNNVVFSLDQLVELVAKFYAQLVIAIKFGNDLAVSLLKSFLFVGSVELKLVISLLDALRFSIEIFLGTVIQPRKDVNFTIGFKTELGEQFIKNLTATYKGWIDVRAEMDSAVNAKTNASIIEFEASVNAAFLLLTNATANNSVDLLNLLLTFGNQLGVVIVVKYKALYEVLIDGGFKTVAAELQKFYIQVVGLMTFTTQFIASLTNVGTVKATDLHFNIRFSTILAAKIQTAFTKLYGFDLGAKGIIAYVGLNKFSDNVTRFEDSIDLIIKQVKDVTIGKSIDLLALLINVKGQLNVTIEYSKALVTGYAKDGLYVLAGVFYYFGIALNTLLDLAVQYIGPSSTILTVVPTTTTPPPDVGIFFGFAFAFEAEFVVIFNGAYRAYFLWKAAVAVVVDVTLKNAVVALEEIIDSAFAIFVGKTVASLDVLVEWLSEFFAKLNTIVQIGADLQAQFMQAGQLAIVAVSRLFFGIIGGLYAAITNIVPTVATTTNPSSSITPTPPTPFLFYITFDFGKNTELLAKISNSYSVVFNWQEEINLIGGSFNVQLKAWVELVLAAFGDFNGKSLSNINDLDVVLKAFIGHLNQQIESGKTLLQEITSDNGTTRLINVVDGDINVLVELSVYLNGIVQYLISASTVTPITSTTPGRDLGFYIEIAGFLLGDVITGVINGAYAAFLTLKAVIEAVVIGTFKASIETFFGVVVNLFTLVSGKVVTTLDGLFQLLINFSTQLTLVIGAATKLAFDLTADGLFFLNGAFNVFIDVVQEMSKSIIGFIATIGHSITSESSISTVTSIPNLGFEIIIIGFDLEEVIVGVIDGAYLAYNTLRGAIEAVVVGTFKVEIDAFLAIVDKLFDIIKGQVVSTIDALYTLLVSFSAQLKLVIDGATKLAGDLLTGGLLALSGAFNLFISVVAKLSISITGYIEILFNDDNKSNSTIPVGYDDLGFEVNIVGTEVVTAVLSTAYETFTAFRSAAENVLSTLGSVSVDVTSFIEFFGKLFAVLRGKVINATDGFVILLIQFSTQLKLVIANGTKLQTDLKSKGFLELSETVRVVVDALTRVQYSVVNFIQQHSDSIPALNFEIDLDAKLDKQLAFFFGAIYKFYVTYKLTLYTDKFNADLEIFLNSGDVVFESLKNVTVYSQDDLKTLLVKVTGEMKTTITNGRTLCEKLWDDGTRDAGIEFFLSYLESAIKLIVKIDSDETECNCVDTTLPVT